MTFLRRLRVSIVLLLLTLICCVSPARAYSLLTHEQLIDLTWKSSIVPLLLSRYPNLTPAQLEEARAYAYGGCVIQDIGYYPFGDRFFSNLTHYVRTGDFVVNLFRNAQNADELAFAVGALSHYIGDTIGHSQATNLAVPVEFPTLAARFGSSVSYEQGERQHVQTEFAFDINELSHHRMAPVHYLRHIGMQVSTRQLAAATYQTYGIGEDFSDQRSRRVNVRGYRFAVRAFIPRIAYALDLLHRRHEPAELLTPERLELNRQIDLVAVENNWALYHKEPGIGTYSLAGLLYILPKVGPIKLAAIKGPTQLTDQQYAHSVLTAVNTLSAVLARFTPQSGRSDAARLASILVPQLPSDTPQHPIPNRDLDTGDDTVPGTYRLTDATYAALLHRLVLAPAGSVPATIQQSIRSYYADPQSRSHTSPHAWSQIQTDLAALTTRPITPEPDPYATYPTDPASN